MSATPPPTIDALPPPPQTSDPANFDARADAYLGALPTHATQVNAASANVYANALEAKAQAVASEVSAADSAASAADAADSATLAANVTSAVLWVSGTTYAKGAAAISTVNVLLYRRLVAGAGTTDPSLDPVNWTLAMPTPAAAAIFLANNFGAL